MMRTHKRGLRLILLLLIASMLVGICPGMAETRQPKRKRRYCPAIRIG